jgi:hypothetical protein
MTDLLDPDVRKDALISECGLYRYKLTRFWGPEHALPFVMLNPSTADASVDDPTIRRCMGFARREKAGGIIVVNLYGLRATEPAELHKIRDPFGPENRANIHALGKWAFFAGTPIVCAWGAHGWFKSANRDTVHLLKSTGASLVCLGTTKAGEPKHPLYIKGDQPLVPFMSDGTALSRSPQENASE